MRGIMNRLDEVLRVPGAGMKKRLFTVFIYGTEGDDGWYVHQTTMDERQWAEWGEPHENDPRAQSRDVDGDAVAIRAGSRDEADRIWIEAEGKRGLDMKEDVPFWWDSASPHYVRTTPRPTVESR
jgi:hypothetical protein